ncbi:MAG: SBBP repeat-containing protein, partial [Armatimonadetes bacterium]|nr:SBBP repeat-containing protein [Armatimonadota bacterium]
MKKTSLVLVLLLISIFSFAQAPDWQWAAQAGGNSYDRGNAITIDDAGNSYVIGKFEDTATFGSYSLTSSGLSDIFVSKIDSLGIFIWATKAGGISEDIGYGITIDDTGNSYVTGCFEETATFGSYTLTSNGRYDIFVAKMDTNGNWLWASKAGGNWYDQALDISKDNFGNCYVTGYFNETVSFGSYSLTSSGLYDIFIAKIDTNGNWLWASKAGGDSYDRGYGITIDDTGNSYVTGCFEETATFGSYSLTSSGSNDIFVAKMDEDGNWLWVTQAGGTGNDIGYAITIDYNGNCYVT